MRKIIWLVHMTADGFVSGPAGELDWAGANIDDELWDHENQSIAAADAALFGRVTYQMFEQYWPAVAANPARPRHERDFSRWIGDAQKMVASTTLSAMSWQNSALLGDDLLQQVTKMKEQPGKNMILFASFTLAARLLTANLIDELHIEIHPVLLGAGKSMFPHPADHQKLTLIDSRNFRSGVIGLRYKIG